MSSTVIVKWRSRNDPLYRGECVVDTWEDGLAMAETIRGRGPYDAEVEELNP